MNREKWIQENNVYETVMGIIREAYNAGYLEGKRDGSPILNHKQGGKNDDDSVNSNDFRFGCDNFYIDGTSI